jgi:hypothetical protein
MSTISVVEADGQAEAAAVARNGAGSERSTHATPAERAALGEAVAAGRVPASALEPAPK